MTRASREVEGGVQEPVDGKREMVMVKRQLTVSFNKGQAPGEAGAGWVPSGRCPVWSREAERGLREGWSEAAGLRLGTPEVCFGPWCNKACGSVPVLLLPQVLHDPRSPRAATPTVAVWSVGLRKGSVTYSKG